VAVQLGLDEVREDELRLSRNARLELDRLGAHPISLARVLVDERAQLIQVGGPHGAHEGLDRAEAAWLARYRR
jgi:hypothetical protein